MKLLKKTFERDGSGSVSLVPEDNEDMWHAYNVIRVGDVLEMKSQRKIMKNGDPSLSTRKILRLAIRAEKIEYDAPSGELRINGPTQYDVEDVPTGSYHTFQLEVNRNFTLTKEEWDSMDMETINTACDPESKAEVGAIVMQEGLANICLLTDAMTLIRQRVEQSMPKKKRGDNSGYEKATVKFYRTIYDTFKRNLNIEKLKAIIIASPGFVARGFYDYMNQHAVDENDKTIVKNKFKFLVTHSSSGHIQALDEVLKNPDVSKQLSDTKYSRETKALDDFFKLLNEDDGRAWYGPKHIDAAVEQGAVKTLFLTDTLFRSFDVALRKKYIAMVDDIRNIGGEVFILSSMHESGEELDAITGVAAILKYAMPELEEIEVDDD